MSIEIQGDYQLCTRGKRVCGALIDVVGGWFLIVALNIIPAIGPLLGVGVVGMNAWQQGKTGQSLGKHVMGTYLVSAITGKPIGGWQSIGRQLLHLVFDSCLTLGVGWVIGIVTGRTLADRIMKTVAVMPKVTETPQPVQVQVGPSSWPGN